MYNPRKSRGRLTRLPSPGMSHGLERSSPSPRPSPASSWSAASAKKDPLPARLVPEMSREARWGRSRTRSDRRLLGCMKWPWAESVLMSKCLRRNKLFVNHVTRLIYFSLSVSP